MTEESQELDQRQQHLNQIIAAYLEAEESGNAPDKESFLRKHAQYAAELKSFFADRDQFQRYAKNAGGSDALTAGDIFTAAEPVGTMVRYVGDYELHGEIARGGMGVVYKARQVSVNRPVALKMILSGHLADENDVLRFQSEAEAAANLDHPNIVPIYEVGEYKNEPYFSMKLIVGGSLIQSLPRYLNNHRSAVELMVTVAKAVHHAHQRGILHRDLKPGNILIDENGQPHITDFGLAKRFTATNGNTQKAIEGLTKSGAIVGTPEYMAPEQAAGQKDLTIAADVYSLGAILYILLTGKPVFTGDHLLETLKQVAEAEPTPPRFHNSNIHPDLETICLKCLAKDPNRRYGSAQDFTEDLQRWLEGEPITARPVGSMERAWRWCRRHPAVACLSFSVVFFILVGSVTSAFLAVQANRYAQHARGERAMALAAQQNALEAKKFAEQQEKLARESEQAARQNLYVSHINQAHQAWQLAQPNRVKELLESHILKKGAKDFRGFEWFYLYRLLNKNRKVLPDTGAFNLGYSPDGKYLVTSGTMKSNPKFTEIVVRDARSRAVIHQLKGPHGFLANFAFTSDSKYLLAVSRALKRNPDGFVWELASGKQVGKFPGETAIAIHPNGKMVATSGENRVVLVDWESGKEIQSFKCSSSLAESLDFSPDGSLLAAGGSILSRPTGKFDSENGKSIHVWDLKTGEKKFSRKQSDSPSGESALQVAFSPNGKWLATGGTDKMIILWDTSGKKVRTLIGHNSRISSIAWSNDSEYLASGSWDRTVRVWKPKTGEQFRILKGHPEFVTCVVFTPDQSRIASVGSKEEVNLWMWKKDQEKLTIRGFKLAHQSLAFSPTQDFLAVGSQYKGNLGLWDIHQGKRIRRLQMPGQFLGILMLRFSPDGEKLLGVGYDSSQIMNPKSGFSHADLFIWDTNTGKIHSTVKDLKMLLMTYLAVRSDLRQVAYYDNNNIVVMDPFTGTKSLTLPVETKSYPVALGPNGKYLATFNWRVQGNSLGYLSLWDLRAKKKIWDLKQIDRNPRLIQFDPEGEKLAVVTSDEAIIWNIETKAKSTSIKLSTTLAAAFTPDLSRLATVDQTGKIFLWHVATGQQLLSLYDPSTLTTRLVFSPDGRHIAASSMDQ